MSLLLWLVFSLGRGIPEGQAIPASRLIRDFPSSSSHRGSLPSLKPATVSSSQAASLRPPAASTFSFLRGSGPRRLLKKSSSQLGNTISVLLKHKAGISKRTLSEFTMNCTVTISSQNSQFKRPLLEKPKLLNSVHNKSLT